MNQLWQLATLIVYSTICCEVQRHYIGVCDGRWLQAAYPLVRHLKASRREHHTIAHDLSVRSLHAWPSEAFRFDLQATARNNQCCPLGSYTSRRKHTQCND